MNEKSDEMASPPSMRYPCFNLQDCGNGKIILEFDSVRDRELYKVSMLELLGRLVGNRMENMQIPLHKTEDSERNGKACLTLTAMHELGEETNGYLYRGVLVEPRILRITDIPRFHRLMDLCRVRGGQLPPFNEIKEYVKGKRMELLRCLRNEGIQSTGQLSEYHRDKA